jgi:meromycolic acid enoyl-[acyl-carrier-protein] reductase
MGILDGKNVLVTGLTHNTSIAFEVARIAQAEGARVAVSNFGRAMSLSRRVIQKLEPVPPLLELDVTQSDDLAALAGRLREEGFERVDGVVHSIAFANAQTSMGGKFLDAPGPDVDAAVRISAYSLVSLAMACKPLMTTGSSIVGLTFDASVAWPAYDWMGVAKAALESTSRYLARYLGPEGIRSNLVAAGPLETLAKRAIPGAEAFNDVWSQRAPLGWNAKDNGPTARAVVALLSDWFPATTAEIVHVDGGLHAMGA